MLRYRLRDAAPTPFPRPADMEPLLHALLVRRGVGSADEAERFLNPRIEHLHDPMLLSDMSAAVDRIRRAIAGREPVCVYGDYDVDGVSASALLAASLRRLGARVEVYLPSRHAEGYGLNEAAVRAIAGRCRLMVTVDCGVTSVELVALARSLGLDCVVTDHHRPADALPDCPVVNPLLNGYPYPSLCGAGVAFKLVQALAGLDAAMAYVDIAALATVADVVPLTGENRVLVRLGLDRINADPRPGIRALIDVAGLQPGHVSAGNIAFQLAPRLNAGGRMGSATRSHELLLCGDPDAADALAAELDAENESRKAVEDAILAEAEEQLAGFDFPAHRAIVLSGEGWNPGVIGLAASRLVEKYRYPTILLSQNGALLTGSCRSIPGVDIHAALTAVREHLIRFGGHRQAAGLTMDAGALNDFRRALDAHLSSVAPPDAYVPELEYDLEVSLGDLTEVLVARLDALQPTGFGNPAPVLRSRAHVLEARAVGRDGAHLRLLLAEGGAQRGGIFFRAGDLAGAVPDAVDALYAPKLNAYLGRVSVQLEVKSLMPGDVLSQISAKFADEDDLQHDFLTGMLYNRAINSSGRMPEPLSIDALASMLSANPQGTLILAAGADVVRKLAMLPSPPELFFGAAPGDPRAFNALCAYPPPELPAGYRRIVLADAPDAWAVPEGAELFRVCVGSGLTDLLPDLDQMRQVYKALLRLRDRPTRCETLSELAGLLGADTRLDPVCCAASLLALHDMKLLELSLDRLPIRLKLNPMRKTDPEDSAVWRAIQAWRRG